MNLNSLKTLYNSSPFIVRKMYSILPINLRNGKDYRYWIRFLNSSNSNHEIYQLNKLRETLVFSYENTDYYKNLFDQIKFNPYQFSSFKEFEHIPYLTKELVRDNFESLKVKMIKKSNCFYVTTGGSSGQQAKFLQSNNVWKKELAYIHYYFGKYNYNPKELKASFRGGDFNNMPNNIYWKSNPIQNEIHFSPFHIDKNTIGFYVAKLNKIQPLFFHGYPSSILTLLDNIKIAGLKLAYQPLCVFLVSENYTSEQLDKIREFFKCEIFTFYGHSERLIFAPAINSSLSCYQPDPFYGYFELIDDHEVIRTNYQEGEIVGTSFDNWAMPLIRYKTNDISSYIDFNNQKIGLIQGRWKQDYLCGLNDQEITLTALNMHSDIFKNVLNYQFFQERKGFVELRLIINEIYSQRDQENIINALNKKAGHAISFSIRIVDGLELTERGKLKNLVKNIKDKTISE